MFWLIFIIPIVIVSGIAIYVDRRNRKQTSIDTASQVEPYVGSMLNNHSNSPSDNGDSGTY
ncbi:hypothetical protein [Chengkuizengella axinellae]|uniref:YtzI protein n=1 Tax=Chengkuizengella axinellae TaxID=3064388 RepID=A0ABT9J493_9BACL|nr:hypothetical protein [Chengkuizengella sp. 2205SS18-9]MDP5276424.1 hypothetical protein [Chengkuizengella sp. 2205SS18-9]